MAFRKRRSPAPGFRQPAPFNPIIGEFAPIGRRGIVTRVAMMQVIEDDTHDNYVVCRGFDPEIEKFLHSVCVAKPYGVRGTFPYVVAQMLVCAKPRTRIGDTPGVAHTTVGHPADLDEVVDILLDDDSNPIAWIEIGGGGGGGGGTLWGKVQSDIANGHGNVVHTVSVKAVTWGGAAWSAESGDAFDVIVPMFDTQGFSGGAGSPLVGQGYPKDTAIFQGYVLGYQVQPDGSKLVVTDVWDEPIGSRRWVDRDTAIRDGWVEDTDVRDRFIVGRGTAWGSGISNLEHSAYNEQGGSITHGGKPGPTGWPGSATGGSHQLCSLLHNFQYVAGSGGDPFLKAFDNADELIDAYHVPPFCTYVCIKRTT